MSLGQRLHNYWKDCKKVNTSEGPQNSVSIFKWEVFGAAEELD